MKCCRKTEVTNDASIFDTMIVTARVKNNMVKTPLSRLAWQMKITEVDEEIENSNDSLTETQKQILNDMVFVQQEDHKVACKSMSSDSPPVPHSATTVTSHVAQYQLSSSQEDLVNQISCHVK